jgi:arabinofuranosyltransferase
MIELRMYFSCVIELYLHTMNSWLSKHKALLFPFLALYSFLVIRTSWVSDDAIITFRSLENFLHGYGLVFNIGERVQTFTHPLWFLIQAVANFIFNLWKSNPFGQGQMYFLNIFISIAISILMISIFTFKVAASTKGAILGLLILSVSKAFIDYSTSGLENPLTHLILLLFILTYLTQKENSQRNIFILGMLAALGGVDRLDTLLFYFPALFILFWQNPNKGKTLITIGLGFLPLIAWELFSLFYYGVPFPNTAYAKINTGIPVSSLIRQGIFYFQNSLRMDPITLVSIFAISIVGLINKNKLHRAIIAGVLLYLLYTVYIGGDFMSGRYFSAPLLACIVLLSTMNFKSPKVYGLLIGLVLLIGIVPIYLIPERNPAFGIGDDGDHRIFIDEHEISDERIVYTGLGLFERLKKRSAPSTGYARDQWVYLPDQPVRVRLVGPLGLNSMTMGPNFHMIDLNSLADPLMTRMPLYQIDKWRIGHFRHIIPEGYMETLATGKNLIADKNIALYYDKLAFVVKGDLWDWRRIVEIWNLNTGKYDYLLKNIPATGE